MSDKNTSQTQQNQTPNAKASAAGVTQLETFFRELQKAEEKNLEAANKAIEESARLWKESVAYGAKLSNEWRTLALKTTKQWTDMMSASFPS